MYFDASQILLATRAFVHAEKMAAQYYHTSYDKIRDLRYDIKTLAYLEKHEVNERAFAHLCRYRYHPERIDRQESGFHFYRVCLQDNSILDAIQRTSAFIKLPPLLLYIATHELIHVIRFDGGEESFEALPEEKDREEQRVHAITQEILSSLIYPDLKLVVDCFSDRHRIDNLLN